jgi:hypothetical protein
MIVHFLRERAARFVVSMTKRAVSLSPPLGTSDALRRAEAHMAIPARTRRSA